mgnify:CR=1 FL=1
MFWSFWLPALDGKALIAIKLLAIGWPSRSATSRASSSSAAINWPCVALPVTHQGGHHYETTVPGRPAVGTGQDRCRWRLVSTSARFAATAAEGDEVFEARLTAGQLAREKPVVLYYWRGTYPRMPGAIITRALGEPDRQVFRPEFQNQLFTITLTPRAAP